MEIPIEEYMFFVIQTLMVALLYSMLSRASSPPILHLSPFKGYMNYVCSLCTAGFLTASIWGWYAAVPNTPLFYFGCICFWACPILAMLWYLGGAYIIRRWRTTFGVILPATLYFCLVDTFAIRRGIWQISSHTSLDVHVWDGLPVEEASFFFVTTFLVVCGSACFEKAFIILHTLSNFRGTESSVGGVSFSYFTDLLGGLLQNSVVPLSVIEDISSCIDTLKQASSSFYSASFLFPPNVRQDLCVLYAFCRVSDDVVDESNGKSQSWKRQQLNEMRSFIDEHFLPAEDFGRGPPRLLKSKMCRHAFASHRALVYSLSHKVPRGPFMELLRGYDYDLRSEENDPQSEIQNESDLRAYCANVASSVAEMCLWLMCDSRHWERTIESTSFTLVKIKAREMGEVLQLVNITRDVLSDALIGRVYIPSNHFRSKSDRSKLVALGRSSTKDTIGEATSMLDLESCALMLLRMAEIMYEPAREAIQHLPRECRPGVRAATDAYWHMGRKLKVELCKATPRSTAPEQ